MYLASSLLICPLPYLNVLAFFYRNLIPQAGSSSSLQKVLGFDSDSGTCVHSAKRVQLVTLPARMQAADTRMV